MKRNAMLRIVIWSVVIVLLSAVLVFFLGIRIGFIPDLAISSSSMMVTEPRFIESDDPVYYSKEQAASITVTVLEELNLRTSPSPTSQTVTLLTPGTVLTVIRTENIGGELWGYVAEPDSGWIQMQYVEEEITIAGSDTPASTTPAPGGAESQGPITATVLENMNLRKSPSPMAETVTMLPAGTKLEILKTETFDGKLWGYVEAPAPGGWLVMQYVETDSPLPEADNQPQASASTAPAVPGGAASVPASEIRDISIDWAAGSITVIPTDSDQIYFYEEGGRSDRPMTWRQREGKLSIEFCDEHFFGIGIGVDIKKDLTIQIPRDISLKELEIDAASAKVHVTDLTVREVNLDTASGTVDFVNCTVDSMDVDTASGNISFTGSLAALECDAASADFEAVLTNVPRIMEMDSASGSLKLTLPENAGFSVNVDGLSSRFSSDFETTMQNGRYIHGDGACRIDMEAMSGKVTIKKAQ